MKKTFFERHVCSILFILIGFVLLGSMQYAHELAHQQIYRHYHIDSKIVFDLKDTNSKGDKYFRLYTKPEKTCPTEACSLAQHQNEIFGYVFFPFSLMVFFAFLFITIIMENKYESRN